MRGKRKFTPPVNGPPYKTRKEEGMALKRPKRQVISKNVDQSTGLSWREETDLKKALYASLQESKRLSRGQDDDEVDDDDEVVISPRSRLQGRHLLGVPPGAIRQFCADDSSQDSMRTATSSSTQESKKMTVHAQRKFAQGQSQPCTPSTTPIKTHSTPVKLFSKRAKTEDFLTFLCLRGSSVLPPHLDFFGYSRDDSHTGVNRPNTPGQTGRCDSGETRESTPDLSSSSDSDMTYEVPDLAALVMKNQQTPTRKAARASASTPETARGLVSIRTGITKKVGKVPAKALLKQSKTLLASPTKMSPRGKRALLRHQRSPTKPKSNSKSGHDGKGVMSKPVRASATPSKKRITPQSLPIGSLPKFYIDDSDSSAQSRDPKEVFVNRRGKSHTIITKKAKPLRMKLQNLNLKRNFKKANTSTSKEKIVMKKTTKHSPERKVPLKMKGLGTKLPHKKVKRLKEKTGAAGSMRKKRMAAMAKNYAEDHDDDLESIDDIDNIVHLPMTSKPVKKTLVAKKVNKKCENRRKIVAVSLAKMSAAKKLSQVKKTANRRKLTQNIPAASLKKSKSVTKMKSKASQRETELKQNEKEDHRSSPPSTPKRRGRPRSSRLSSSPGDRTDDPALFPLPDDGGHIVEVPTFYPTSKEFQDPLKYIASIRQEAEPYGMCRVIPPSSWKPEYKVNEELRFTSQLQYIHRLQNRWGPNVQQMECIKKHLTSINVDCEQPPLIGGIEVDLPKLHQTIQVFGGAQNVGEKKTWIKVADAMKIPKLAQDRATKLYDAYCKYLLSYDTLSYEEKTKLEQQVRNERQKRVKSQNQQNDSVVKGRSTSLGDFTRVARNTVSMWFKEDPTLEQVECEYWKLLQDGQSHVVVQCGHVDTSSQGSAFPVRRDSPCARHGWNFNVLTQNPGSVLKSMGPVTGVTTPTLHIGMLFTTSCWSTDLHRLPYIQYLHTGADTVWYSIPKSEERKFKRALSTIVPELVNDQTTWLPEDTVMVSPDSLSQKGVSIGRCTQSQGQFMVVFSHCHTATLSCGYSISESVHFAYADWIKDGMRGANQLNEMAEPELFSMEAFLCNLVKTTTNKETLSIALSHLKLIMDEESIKADQLMRDGLKSSKMMYVNKDLPSTTVSGVKRRSLDSLNKEETVCDVCKKICFLFMVLSETEDTLCLDHAASHIQRKKNLKGYQLHYRYSQEELRLLLSEAEERLGERDTTPEKAKSGLRRRTSNLRSTSQSSTSQS